MMNEVTGLQRTELAELEARQREGRKELLAQQAERRRVLSRLATQIRSQRREIKSLQRDEARLSRLVEELGKIVSPRTSGRRNEKLPESGGEGGAFASLKGKLRLPARGELINRFGGPRSEGRLSWKGLFIRGASGEEVRAVAAGRVVFAEWLRGFGNLVLVKHADNWVTAYAHNETLLVRRGDKVTRGQAIAQVGSTGNVAEPQLHFEIRQGTRAVNPMGLLDPQRAALAD